MKKIIAIVIFCISLHSCIKEQEVNGSKENFNGKWTLSRMSSSRPNTETTGEAMVWQESYTFSKDSTFTKTRVENAKSTTVSGTFSFKKETDGEYLILTHAKKTELIGSCMGNLQEILYFSDKNTLSSTWKNCDGPGLEYNK